MSGAGTSWAAHRPYPRTSPRSPPTATTGRTHDRRVRSTATAAGTATSRNVTPQIPVTDTIWITNRFSAWV